MYSKIRCDIHYEFNLLLSASAEKDIVVTPPFITFVRDIYTVLESVGFVILSLENTGGLNGTVCKFNLFNFVGSFFITYTYYISFP